MLHRLQLILLGGTSSASGSTPGNTVPDKAILARDGSAILDRSGNYIVTR